MIASILVPLDGSVFADRALPFAVSMARANQARLSLLHAMPAVPTLMQPWSELDVAAKLEGMAAQLRERGLQATARTTHGDAANAILDAATDAHADLIVMATHGRGGIGRWLFGSVADQVLSRTTIPVMMIPASRAHVWPEDRPPRILVPLDGSDLAEQALAVASATSGAAGVSLLLMRVVPRSTDLARQFDPVHLSLRCLDPARLREAEQYLEEIASSVHVATGPVDVLVEEGDPPHEIAKVAQQERVDLIAMATHGRTGLARVTLGSVATAILQQAQTPVLLVRPAGLSGAPAESTDMKHPAASTVTLV
jgi:nucleotide-binding universal stress UspA family protein